MPNMREDLRTLKTKRAIEEAFLELVTEKDFSSVKITEIAERAEVNRNTIYLHYSSKEGIVSKIVERTFAQEFNELDINDFIKVGSKKEAKRLFNLVYQVLQKNERAYRLILADSSMAGHMMLTVRSLSFLTIDSIADNPQNQIVFDYILNGVFGVAQKWFLYDQKENEHNIDVLADLFIANIRKLKRS